MLKHNNRTAQAFEDLLFGSKWLLIPFYLGLMVALFVYLLVDVKEVFHMVIHSAALTKESSMLVLLELVDMAMIANLVKMIITGSYSSFVNKNHSHNSDKASSGLLKVKMSTSLVGVSSIHLLQTFINAESVKTPVLYNQLLIHATFVVGSLLLAFIEYIHVKGEAIEHGLHSNNTTITTDTHEG